MTTLKDRLDEAREKRSPSEFARLIGITRSAMSQLLSGKSKSMKAENALRLEDKTGYRARWVVLGETPKRLKDPETPERPPKQDALLLADPDRHELNATWDDLGPWFRIALLSHARALEAANRAKTCDEARPIARHPRLQLIRPRP